MSTPGMTERAISTGACFRKERQPEVEGIGLSGPYATISLSDCSQNKFLEGRQLARFEIFWVVLLRADVGSILSPLGSYGYTC